VNVENKEPGLNQNLRGNTGKSFFAVIAPLVLARRGRNRQSENNPQGCPNFLPQTEGGAGGSVSGLFQLKVSAQYFPGLFQVIFMHAYGLGAYIADASLIMSIAGKADVQLLIPVEIFRQRLWQITGPLIKNGLQPENARLVFAWIFPQKNKPYTILLFQTKP
jgi:hypothetical protein